MENFDPRDELALRRLDDLALEEVRVQMIADRGARLDVVIRELVLRAVRVIESICRTQGTERDLSNEQILKAIEDATARLLLRLARPDRLRGVTALGAEIADECVAAQTPQPTASPRLASRQPKLLVVDQLGDAVKRGRLRRNNWSDS